MEIKQEFLYEGQPAFVILTDDPRAAVEYKKQGVCCIGINREDAFFEGVSYVVPSEEDVDEHLLQKAWCRFHHIPFVVFRTEDLIGRESISEDYEDLRKLTDGVEYIEFPELDVFKAYVENAYHFWGYGIWTILAKTGDEWEKAGWIGIEPVRETEMSRDLVKYYYGNACRENAPELGFVIRKDLRGRGIAKRACQQIIEYASTHLGIETLVIRTGKDNAAAKALALSLGFQTSTYDKSQTS